LKQAPAAAEIEEGVAFYGRAGNALRKSFKRLNIDPLVVYGTLCVKCPVADPSLAAGECVERVVPLSQPIAPELGRIQQLTPTVEALYVPDIDESLDSEESKREFWTAF